MRCVCSSGRIYIVDTVTDPLKPALHKTVEPEEILEKTGLAFPHTAHCLANGDIMVSCLGDKEGRAEGAGFLLLDEKFNVKGRSVRANFVLLVRETSSVLHDLVGRGKVLQR